MSPRIEQFKRAVERACLCKANHVASEPVAEAFEGKTVWEGTVEIFDLDGHDTAKRGYAFTFADTDGVPVVKTVLGVSPIDCAQHAVRAVIVDQRKKR